MDSGMASRQGVRSIITQKGEADGKVASPGEETEAAAQGFTTASERVAEPESAVETD